MTPGDPSQLGYGVTAESRGPCIPITVDLCPRAVTLLRLSGLVYLGRCLPELGPFVSRQSPELGCRGSCLQHYQLRTREEPPSGCEVPICSYMQQTCIGHLLMPGTALYVGDMAVRGQSSSVGETDSPYENHNADEQAAETAEGPAGSQDRFV